MRATAALVLGLQRLSRECFGASQNRGEIVLALAQSEHGSAAYADLEALLSCNRRTLQHILRRLEGDGMVTVRRSRSDQRRAIIALTPAARAALERFTAAARLLMADAGIEPATARKLAAQGWQLVI